MTPRAVVYEKAFSHSYDINSELYPLRKSCQLRGIRGEILEIADSRNSSSLFLVKRPVEREKIQNEASPLKGHTSKPVLQKSKKRRTRRVVKGRNVDKTTKIHRTQIKRGCDRRSKSRIVSSRRRAE